MYCTTVAFLDDVLCTIQIASISALCLFGLLEKLIFRLIIKSIFAFCCQVFYILI